MTDPRNLPLPDPFESPEFDLESLLEAAQSMQAKLVEAQAQAAEQVVEGVAGGGAVRIRATAGLEFRRVTIRPDAVDPAEVDMLEDLVLAALRDVVTRANEVQAQALGTIGGLGLPGVPGLPGTPAGDEPPAGPGDENPS